MPYALGVICYGWHEAAAVLVRDGEVIAAAEEERFSRQKFDPNFPEQAIAFCLNHAGISSRDLSAIGYGFDPRRRLGSKALHLVRYFPASMQLVTKRGKLLQRMNQIEGELRDRLDFTGKIYRLNHHLCHAASTFFASPFDRAAILTLDGAGDWESCWWGVGENASIEQFNAIDWPQSLGHLYAAFTEYLGFKPFSDEYKVMGLAPYGEAKYGDRFADILYPTPTGYHLNLDYFQFQTGHFPRYGSKLIETFGQPLHDSGNEIPTHYCNVAASLQAQLETVIFHMARLATEKADSRNLCLAGGVAMNSVANGKIVAKGLVDRLYIPPCASDAGVALGAAYLAHLYSMEHLKRHPVQSAQLGPEYGDEAISSAIQNAGLQAEAIDEPAKVAAGLIATGKVIGWFQGRMEFGQRALGSRSILADPRRSEMKEIVNTKIKFRENFRPFAPSVLEEHVDKYFNFSGASPFMTQVHSVREEQRSSIPAVTHIDGTGRVQTVSQTVNPSYWKLIHYFGEKTGIPVVLNTSFNIKGQPIVNRPEEAISTFLNTEIDALVCGRYCVQKVEL